MWQHKLQSNNCDKYSRCKLDLASVTTFAEAFVQVVAGGQLYSGLLSATVWTIQALPLKQAEAMTSHICGPKVARVFASRNLQRTQFRPQEPRSERFFALLQR